MARKRTTRAASEPAATGVIELPPMESAGDGPEVETTGRFIVIFKDEAMDEESTIPATLSQVAGLRHVAAAADYEAGAVTAEDLASNDVVHFNKLGIVLVSGEDAVQALAASASDADSPILAIEPEYVAYLSSLASGGLSLEYLRGFRDAANRLYEEGTHPSAVEGADAEAAAVLQDTAQFTWGLQATGVSTSRRSGQGIRVAVLDTGMDLAHPDFRGRSIVSQSFSGFPVQDIHGHGTHCVGTACGPQRPATGVRRYGVASATQIFVGKVFNQDQPNPRAPTGNVVAGIEWAVTNGCQVVSLSLGARINQRIEQYETPMRRALNAGTLVVCAAGNNASRPQNPGFVEPPANADAAMAVAALDSRLQMARFSGRSSQLTGVGGRVNIAGPGVGVFSSVPVNRGVHSSFDGTSMATPHVAGIAALWAEATGERGPLLWNRLLRSARPLSLLSSDAGAGLVQAPQ